MKRIVRRAGIAAVLLLLLVFSLPFLIDANRFRPMLESGLSNALGRDVKVGGLKLAILSGGVTADDLSVADDPAYSRTPFLHARSLTFGVDLRTLIFSRKLHINRLTMEQPQIDLLQSAAGDWNFSGLGRRPRTQARLASSHGPALDLSVSLVQITGGLLSFSQLDSSAKAKMLGDVNIELRNFSGNAPFPFTLTATVGGGGDIKVDGMAGPIDPLDAAQTPAKVRVKVSQFDLGAAVAENGGALAGMLSLNGVAASNGRTLFLSGRILAERLRLARNGSPAREPVAFDFTLEHDLRKQSGVLRRGEIRIGGTPAKLTGTYAPQGGAMVVNLNLSGAEMPVPQLAAMLPALGIVLPAGSSLQGGTASVELSFEGPFEFPVISGSIGLHNTGLAGFSLGAKLSALGKLAGIQTGGSTGIESFTATVRLAAEGGTAHDIKLVAPALGELTGDGAVSPSHALDFRMRATLHAGGVLAPLGPVSIPFRIEGTAANPVFKPDVQALVTEKIKAWKRTR